ncbi:MAG: neutral/alkaline non-lysosomal ceramidase N-terminal domain-containing protein [Candidatus Hydrogenedentes bacterium]|nr:neutral/alkaline non-lysosomal ceramidase N-terminal domain-containing protein [Candidatus Hydrogenedentota bacterium]
MKELTLILALCCMALPSLANGAIPLKVGVARVSINPMEANIPTQLGGYGAREGKPAIGTLDTIYGKVLLFDNAGEKSALVTVDICSVPICLVEETLAKAKIDGLTLDRTLMTASHSHTGLEGYALDRRNVANNPNIGIFSEPMLNFVTDRLAEGLRQANAALQPVKAGSAAVDLPNMNRNRRNSNPLDQQMTVLRLDTASGAPLAVLVNYTAHGTFVDETDMLVSGEWAGSMQRTVEDLMGGGVTCLYTNGAEGDVSPRGADAGSHYEKAYNYGRKVGIAASRLAEAIPSEEVTAFAVQNVWVTLPERKAAPDFTKIAGDEYKVTQEEIDMMVKILFPEKAPLFTVRVNDFQLVSFPGEPISEIGLKVKDTLHAAGIENPCVAALTTDQIGYILTKDEYAKSGYEVTASFYGDSLGVLLTDEACKLATAVAAK